MFNGCALDNNGVRARLGHPVGHFGTYVLVRIQLMQSSEGARSFLPWKYTLEKALSRNWVGGGVGENKVNKKKLGDKTTQSPKCCNGVDY